ncbi:MAG TPA: hypothetical protein CFH84_00665 [Sulfurimonas sp. UBA12504]|nr:MAG: hypothetical protein A2019_09005 [Sulfurimonas sp. GWF2_37_8]DAB31045.1 MAG TPA: hypothetical protein CFH84_00665 [Sulfurimonas sp. UBA12504]
MDDSFNKWNEIKKETYKSDVKKFGIKQREIYWMKLGQNIGSEEYGKNENFTRPIVIVRKLTSDLFLGIPTTTNIRQNSDYFHSFEYLDKNKNSIKVSAMILQIKTFSIKRLMSKIGWIDKNDFKILQEKSRRLIDPTC